MLLEELDKYPVNNHFFFQRKDSLNEVCNAPKNGNGVYILYALADGNIDLIYIGSSGTIQKDGELIQIKGGLFDGIVNGFQFNMPRGFSWPDKMIEEEIEALDIYWFETFNNEVQDIPHCIEALLIQNYFNSFGTLPRWNQEY